MTDEFSISDSESYFEISQYEPSIYSDDKKSVRTTESKKEKQANKATVYTVKRWMKNGNKYKQNKINLFNTSTNRNASIINAVSGYIYKSEYPNIKYKVGSAQENDLFKVRFLTHENNIPGITLFYDNPEQYERHLNVVLDVMLRESGMNVRNNLKQNWISCNKIS